MLARVGLAPDGLAWVGLAGIGLALVELARVGSNNSNWLGLVYCILLDSTSGTAPLDNFPNSPKRSAGLSYTLIIVSLKIREEKRVRRYW